MSEEHHLPVKFSVSYLQESNSLIIHLANICQALTMWWMGTASAEGPGPCIAITSRVQGPHTLPIILCHLVMALSSQPSRAPVRHSLHHQETHSPSLHPPHPSFKAPSSLHHQAWSSHPNKQWSTSCSFSILWKESATPLFSVRLLPGHTLSTPLPLDRLTVDAIPGHLSPQPSIPKSTKKHQPVMVD